MALRRDSVDSSDRQISMAAFKVSFFRVASLRMPTTRFTKFYQSSNKCVYSFSILLASIIELISFINHIKFTYYMLIQFFSDQFYILFVSSSDMFDWRVTKRQFNRTKLLWHTCAIQANIITRSLLAHGLRTVPLNHVFLSLSGRAP